MIRPEDMAGFTDPMERIFLDLQNRIMEDVVRRIVKMGEITRTADMQMGTIRKLGGSTSFIRAELKRMAGLTDKELGRLFSDVIKKGYSDNAEIYRRMGRNFIPAAENRILQSWKKALTDQTAGELKNITRSLGMMWEVRGQKRLLPLADVYQQALDDAAMDIVSGGKSYNTVLRRTVSQLTRSGLRTVDYASGTSTRVEVASRRAVMTGVHQLTGQINLEVAKDLKTDYFEVTWHAGARPEHWWGGRVYSRQQLSLVCGYGSVEGLCGANCRHSFYAFIPGVSKRMYSDEQLAEMNAAEQVKKPYADGKSYTTYEATQKQRQMETVMRAQRERIHLLQQGGADDQEIMLAKCKYQGEIQEYKRFSRAMGLPPQMERVYIDGLGRKAPTRGELRMLRENDLNTLASASLRRYLSNRDQLWKNLTNVPRLDGYQDISCHATPYTFIYQDPETDEVYQTLTAKQFASRLRKDNVLTGKPIRLFSCESGKYDDGVAQQLANILNCEVMAPTKLVFTTEMGYTAIAEDELEARLIIRKMKDQKWSEQGWRHFYPKGKA